MNFYMLFHNITGVKFYIVLPLFLTVLHQSIVAQQNIAADNAHLVQFKTSLQELIEASRNNPRLTSAAAKMQASAAAIDVQKALDPPQVSVELYQSPIASFPNPFRNQMEYDYSIQQMIPFPGKLEAMAGVERKREEMFKSDRQTQANDIVRNVKSLFIELYLKDRQLEINHDTQVLVHEFVAVAQQQYQVGMGQQSDVLRAQTELSALDNDSIVLQQQRKSMEGMLNALCNRPITTAIACIPEIDPVMAHYDFSTLMAIAVQNRSELKAMKSGIEMQQAERLAVRKEYLPDFMLRGTYKQMTQANDDWGLMIGATIPIAPWSQRKYSAGTARADANINGAQSELTNMNNMIASEVNDALLKMESSKERLRLSKETAIPQAAQTLESARAAYRTGKQEFLMLVDIQRMLVMAKLDYHMAVMALLDSQSQLERAVGLDLDEIDKNIEGGYR
jgi:outer membrane protein, heavy metal efflux system